MIRDVDPGNLEATREFLEAHVETSLFLLGNLATHGPTLGAHLNSGNFRVVCEGEDIVAVFCLARRGNLLVQAGGRDDLAATIFAACAAEPMSIQGVVGEWRSAHAIWQLVCANPDFEPGPTQREVLYTRELPAPASSASTLPVRVLNAGDFETWNIVNAAYSAEAKVPIQGTREERREGFASQAEAGFWWGYYEGGELIGTGSLNAMYERIGQVGGVYTRPGYRGRGLAAVTLHKLMRDAFERHRLERLILFTEEANLAARRLYETLGFRAIGHFALLFGTPRVPESSPPHVL